MWHIPLWPLKKISDWLRRHYEKKQLQDQFELLQKQHLLDITPALDVSFRLIRNPDPPRRSDIPIVDVVVKNYGGRTNIMQGRFWISLSDRPGYKEEKKLANIEMPKGKEEKFFFRLIRQFFDKVMTGHSVLEFHYDLQFSDLNGQPTECQKTYTYNPENDTFVPSK
jgi:hypothetical protein